MAVTDTAITRATKKTQIDRLDPFSSFKFIPKTPVTNERGTYIDARMVNWVARKDCWLLSWPCLMLNLASWTLMELISSWNVSIKNFSSSNALSSVPRCALVVVCCVESSSGQKWSRRSPINLSTFVGTHVIVSISPSLKKATRSSRRLCKVSLIFWLGSLISWKLICLISWDRYRRLVCEIEFDST